LTQHNADQGRTEKTGNDSYSNADGSLQAGAGEATFKKYRHDRERGSKKRGRPIGLARRPKIRRGKTENKNKNEAYEYKIQHGIGALA